MAEFGRRKLRNVSIPTSCFRHVWVVLNNVLPVCEEEMPSSTINKAKSFGRAKRHSRIVIPSPSFRVESYLWPVNLNEVESVNDATRAVLCTAERIVSLLWPKRSEGFKFMDTPYSSPATLSSLDHAIAAYSFYGRYGHDETSSFYDSTRIVIISMPCLVLADHEMELFTECRTVGILSIRC
jgi:hypothetical protein